MDIGWQVPPAAASYRVPRAVVLVVAFALAVIGVVAVLAATDHRPPAPVRVDTGTDGGAGQGRVQLQPTLTTTGAAATSAEATTGRAEATSERSVTVVDGVDGHPGGVVVAGSGTATADVGGNVVVGSDAPDGSSSASVSTGDATAVGNRSSTRVGP